jgi:hypothetical protein
VIDLADALTLLCTVAFVGAVFWFVLGAVETLIRKAVHAGKP